MDEQDQTTDLMELWSGLIFKPSRGVGCGFISCRALAAQQVAVFVVFLFCTKGLFSLRIQGGSKAILWNQTESPTKMIYNRVSESWPEAVAPCLLCHS